MNTKFSCMEATSAVSRCILLFYVRGSVIRDSRFAEIQQDATVCRYLFTAKLLYMFRASIAPIISST